MKKIISILLIISLCCFNSGLAYSKDYDVDSEPADSTREICSDKVEQELLNTYRVDLSKTNPMIRSYDPKMLNADTYDLLLKFLTSAYVYEKVFGYNNISYFEKAEKNVDLSQHEYFVELCKRKDLGDALERFYDYLVEQDNSFLWTIFDVFLGYQPVSSAFEKKGFSANSIKASQRLDTGGTINISHSVTGTVNTIDGNTVYTMSPSRQLTETEIGYLNLIGTEYSNNTRLANPSATYNCFSYAWYLYSYNNPYWIVDIYPYLEDSHCLEVVPVTSVREKDIIVYTTADGAPIHAGVVENVSPGGALTIHSKWGLSGVYRHSLYDVPSAYYSNVHEGIITYAIYRYHDYDSYEYTGNSYHSGSFHYYEAIEVCSICSHEGDIVFVRERCFGPPCIEYNK